MTIPPILLVGLGKMGGAMLAGWRERGLAPSMAVDPMMPAAPGPEVMVVADAAAIPAGFAPAAVVLAVKPQNAAETLPLYGRFAGSAVMLSIMAGRTLGGIRALLGEAAVVPPGLVTLRRSTAASSALAASSAPDPATVSRASLRASSGGIPCSIAACSISSASRNT